MFKRIYWTLLSIWQHPRQWRNILACKYAEPLHYHHDGCPACYVNDRKPVEDMRNWLDSFEEGHYPSDEEMDAMYLHYKEGA